MYYHIYLSEILWGGHYNCPIFLDQESEEVRGCTASKRCPRILIYQPDARVMFLTLLNIYSWHKIIAHNSDNINNNKLMDSFIHPENVYWVLTLEPPAVNCKQCRQGSRSIIECLQLRRFPRHSCLGSSCTCSSRALFPLFLEIHPHDVLWDKNIYWNHLWVW